METGGSVDACRVDVAGGVEVARMADVMRAGRDCEGVRSGGGT